MKATSTHVVTPTARERASAARPALLIIAFVILVSSDSPRCLTDV